MEITQKIRGLAGEHNVLQMAVDKKCQKAAIKFNETVIYEGNYWDFHPGCYSNTKELQQLTGWNGYRPHSLMAAIVKFCQIEGIALEILSQEKYSHC